MFISETYFNWYLSSSNQNGRSCISIKSACLPLPFPDRSEWVIISSGQNKGSCFAACRRRIQAITCVTPWSTDSCKLFLRWPWKSSTRNIWRNFFIKMTTEMALRPKKCRAAWPPARRSGTETSCTSSTTQTWTQWMSSANKCGKGTESNADKGRGTPKGTATSGSTCRRARKGETGGPTSLRGHPEVSELRHLPKPQTSTNLLR